MLISHRSIPLLLASWIFSSGLQSAAAFVVTSRISSRPTFQPLYSSPPTAIDSMRAGEIKKELESYGISTKAFLEKTELVQALEKARADGLTPKASTTASSTTSPSSTSTSSSESSSTESSTSSASSPSSSDSRPREERLKEELEKCQLMKAGELKKELQGLGVATNSFLEKKEFAQALAEARVDGVVEKKAKAAAKENYAEYADVEVLTDDSSGPRQSSKQQAPQGGGGNPFGGVADGGGATGGMGGMGGMADMLKNMGGMGGGGGMGGMADMLKNMGGGGGGDMGGMADMLKNMGGMGGMGGGDAMGKAQEMMKNPKVMEMMMKAQSNPKVMKAMQECMSNPAAFAKYQNDPEISGMINELKKYM